MNLFSASNPAVAAAFTVVFLIAGLFSIEVSAQTRAWGENGYGQLGIGNTINQPLPQTVTAMPDATGISSGLYHTLFLKSDGTVAAAGYNGHGQLGTGVGGANQSTPVPVPNLTTVVQVTAGIFHSAALLSDGTVRSWGSNLEGQIGNGKISQPTGCHCIPTPTRTLITNVVQIDAGGYHTLALKPNGSVWAWGANYDGQIGDGGFSDRPTPVKVGANIPGFNNIIAVSAGEYHSMALKADGTVWVWGWNVYRLVGNPNATFYQREPMQTTILTNVTQIAAGGGHNMALRNDGSVWIWGRNSEGQVGNGVASSIQSVPLQNTTLSDVVEIAAGDYFNLVRLRDGSLRFWGGNNSGQAGDGTFNNNKLTPVMPLVGAGSALIAATKAQSFSVIPYLPTTVGTSQRLYGENVDITFSNVTGSGVTSYRSIDPTQTGLSVPPGYTIELNQPAYNITSKATGTGDIDVCLQADGEHSQTRFERLRILHGEGAILVDRTFSSNYRRRQLCARVTSLSAFVVALSPEPTP